MSQIDPAHEARKAVIANELAWHDQEAHRRTALNILLYAPPAFEHVIESSLAFLELPLDEFVLDMACGEGKETLRLAQQGLYVISIDLSYQQLCRARQLLEANAPGSNVYFIQANAEELPIRTESLRIIYGKAILHHLDIDRSGQEVLRVLQHGGRAAFTEPMAQHPLFWLARRLSPQFRTQDEHPLTFKELRHFCSYFTKTSIDSYYLLAPLSYFFRAIPGGEALFRSLYAWLQSVDTWLFRRIALLKDLAWCSLVKIEK